MSVDMTPRPIIDRDQDFSELMQRSWGFIVSRLRTMKVLHILNVRLLQDDRQEFQIEKETEQHLVYERLLSV